MRLRFVLAFASLTAAACGDGPAAIVDASIADGTFADADTTDAAPAMVTVFVTAGGAPVSGVPVYFQNADGSLVSATSTASGVASALMAAGGYATAVLGGTRPSDSPTITTFAGVKPGDTLRLTVPEPFVISQLDFTAPESGSNTHYWVRTPCGQGEIFTKGGPPTITADVANCGDVTDVLVASDNGDGGPITAFLATNVALTPGTPITVSGTYAAVPAAQQTYTNLPSGWAGLELRRQVYTARGSVWDWSNFVDVVGGTADATQQRPTLPATIDVAVGSHNAFGPSRSEVYDTASALDYLLDATGVFLPPFTEYAGFDNATSTITWAEDTTGAAPDFSVGIVDIQRSSLKASWTWRIVAPHAGAGLRLPTLPGTGEVWNPLTDDAVFINGVTTVKVPGGYDAIRADVFGVTSGGAVAGQLAGRVVMEHAQPILSIVPFARSAPRAGLFGR